ncbi:MAG: IS3 family transposase, partial [Sphingomonadaceae bacterium]
AQHPAHHLARLCVALGVSRSGYYAWLRRPESPRQQRDRQLVAAIQALHTRMRERYGAIKTWRALTAAGLVCGRHRVARLRRLHGIEARRTRRFRVMTEHHQLPPPAPNRVRPGLHVVRPDHVWAGDLTAVPTRAGWLYVAVVLDLYSRRVVGWAMSAKPDQQVVARALTMALTHRRPGPGLLHHTDQGAPYASLSYRALLAAHGLIASMSRKGNCYDNATVESFFSTLKNELVHERDYRSREEAQMEIFEYIEIFYNRERIHQNLKYVSPVQFESDNLSPL